MKSPEHKRAEQERHRRIGKGDAVFIWETNIQDVLKRDLQRWKLIQIYYIISSAFPGHLFIPIL
jgi:hypothetical protein